MPNIPNWWDIPIINSQAKERLGYPTQKPISLLDRIIQASSNEGDIVADFFCGCGTTIVSALKNNRQFIGCDISHLSISLVKKRLREDESIKDRKDILDNFKIEGIPSDYNSAKDYFNKQSSDINNNSNSKISHSRRLSFEDYVIEYLLKGVCNEKKSSQGKVHDGYMMFEYDKTKYTCYIECKSGNMSKVDVGSFINDIKTLRQTKPNTIGLIVSFDDYITSGYIKDCIEVGYVNNTNNRLPIVEVIKLSTLLDYNNGIYNNLTPKCLVLGINTTYKGSEGSQGGL